MHAPRGLPAGPFCPAPHRAALDGSTQGWMQTADARPRVTPERWIRIATLFAAVADLAPADRAERLEGTCDREPELRRAVEDLVAADRAAGDGAFITRIVDDAVESFAASRRRQALSGPAASPPPR